MITKRVAILQSNYIPWRGYFDIIGSVDEFIVYDIAQYTKNDWRNRNRIRTAQGIQWLTIPIATSGKSGQTIAEARIAYPGWAEKHWRAISQAYARAPFFSLFRPRLERAFSDCGVEPSLSLVNRALIQAVVDLLGITTRIEDAASHPCSGDRNERLLNLCLASNATTYLTGPSARSYLDLQLFAKAGIEVEFMDYSMYEPYPQVHGGFVPDVSVLDLLFNVGPDAPRYLRCSQGLQGADGAPTA